MIEIALYLVGAVAVGVVGQAWRTSRATGIPTANTLTLRGGPVTNVGGPGPWKPK